MTIRYYNQRRQSGKTSDLVERFILKPENTLLISAYDEQITKIKNNVDAKYYKNII